MLRHIYVANRKHNNAADRFVVKRFPADVGAGASNRNDAAVHDCGTAVGNRNPIADSRNPFRFAVNQLVDKRLFFPDHPVFIKHARHLREYFFLGSGI